MRIFVGSIQTETKIKVKGKGVAYSLKIYQLTLHFTPLSLDLFICVSFQAYILAAISPHRTYRTHLYPTRDSFTPESSGACEDKVSQPRTQTLEQSHNVEREET